MKDQKYTESVPLFLKKLERKEFPARLPERNLKEEMKSLFEFLDEKPEGIDISDFSWEPQAFWGYRLSILIWSPPMKRRQLRMALKAFHSRNDVFGVRIVDPIGVTCFLGAVNEVKPEWRKWLEMYCEYRVETSIKRLSPRGREFNFELRKQMLRALYAYGRQEMDFDLIRGEYWKKGDPNERSDPVQRGDAERPT